ncbi:hypothetical protein COO60DRAFT_1227797 [Scenedesmus sp. NREL 46B-D3]|nr:hypothetical protein COO60DRAFT_1227797 [Scenedesmus sp. NREL 46B-D3]
MGKATHSRPQGIMIMPSNIALLPSQRGVRLLGTQASAVELSEQQMLDVTSCKWRNCPVPTLLGIPLALKQLAPTTYGNRVKREQPAVLMLMDPKSGFAPAWVQLNGLGEVLLARTDGENLTVDELWQLHDYNCKLLDRYSCWCEEGDTREVVAQRTAALTPSAYAQYTSNRAM